jgi:asparagine synthase (glutamine-hydrolysing)
MCGLLAVFGFRPEIQDFRDALLTMEHRGPDAQRVVQLPHNVFLGHCRLSIIDLDERSSQPFIASDDRHIIIYNGEIYNFTELAKQFGIPTRTTCDTEILLELYLRLGESMLDRLNGMFAFVIYDKETGDVFAARDRLGIKPLYYSDDGESVLFSSEIRPIKELAGANDLDLLGVRQYLKARAFFNQRTLYRNINVFPPGHYYKNGAFRKYWDLPTLDPGKSCRDSEVRDLIESAVRYRLISDVSVGSFLSGGLDSTIIAGLANRPDTWTIGFVEDNEFCWGRMAARQFNSRHTEVTIDADEFREIGKSIIMNRQEPMSVPNEVLLAKMSTHISQKNTVILSGEGADELFFGYDRIFRWANESDWDLAAFDHHYSYGSHEDFEILEEILSPVASIEKCIDKVSTFFQVQHLHGLLRRLDSSTMLASIEARVPFVDHRLVEYMYGAPFEYRMQDGEVKAPLKRIFEDLVPEPIRTRKKVGFPVPLDKALSDHKNGVTGMDKWLDFNMSTLLGEQWGDIRECILRESTQCHQD